MQKEGEREQVEKGVEGERYRKRERRSEGEK